MKNILKTNLVLILVAIITGLIVSIIAQAFIITAKNVFAYLYTSPLIINIFTLKLNILPLLACCFAAILISIIIKINNIKRWHGPADSIYAANQRGGVLDIKMGLLSTLASFFSISGGASVGIYGPLVHFGATVGIFLRRLTFMPNIPHDIIIGSGVAAAISAGFGAPIAGIIFAHEVILRHFSLKAISSIAICSFTAKISATQMDLVPPFFNFDEINFVFLESLPGLFIIGPLSAIVALLFMNSLLNIAKFSGNINLKSYQKPFIPAILCGIIGMFLPEVLGLGVNTISNVILNPNLISFLFIILVAKLLLTSICIGFGMFGGVFSPSLFLGAMVGGIIFNIPIFEFSSSMLSVFAIAGMAAVSSSVIGAPITVIILVLELTGSYKYAITSILPICLSNLITLIFFGSSFFDKQLLLRGINMSLGREHIVMSEIKIKDYLSHNYLKFEKDETIKNILIKFKRYQTTEGYFVDKNNFFQGKIRLIDIIDKNKNKGFPFRQKKFIKLDDKDNLIDSINILSNFVGENVPIIDNNGNFLGVVSEGDVLKLYTEITKEIKSIEKS